MLLAFLMVSIASVITFGALGLYAVTAGLSQLTSTERHNAAMRVESETIIAYRATHDWSTADLSMAQRSAWTVGARVTFVDSAGRYVGGTAASNKYLAGSDTTVRPIVVDGSQVGSARIWFSGDAWAAAQARTLLWRSGAVALLAAALVAATASYAVSNRMVRPLRRLTAVAERFRNGDRTARSGQQGAPGEIGCLASALDDSMDVIVAEDAARRRMTADVAHEIRTPLAALEAGLEELRDGYLAPSPDRLAELHDQTLRLRRVVDDLATLASAEASRMSLRQHRLDLAELVRTELASKEALLRAAGIVVGAALLPAPVVGDGGRLAQVVGNLLVNSARYCRSGDRVEVKTGTVGASSYVTVADTGPGIPATDQPHVFERLYRGANAAGTRGSGIGLAIVRELVEAHGGRVAVTSRPGIGTTVTFALPHSDRRADAAARQSPPARVVSAAS